jgi:hypothetical protein
MVVIAGAAPHFGRLLFHNRYNRMVGHTSTFNAIVVDDVAQPKFVHTLSLVFEVYQTAFMRE